MPYSSSTMSIHILTTRPSKWAIAVSSEVYFCKVHFHINLPLAARKYVNTIAEGIAQVGFLTMKTALIPGAVQAWIDAVVFAAEAPAPPTLGYEELRLFTFTPQMGRWLSCTPLASLFSLSL
ncbi:hypothetical protein PQX77_018002 [Marasmius sp. AFHP31]|nr:hypothetical protein PQX77_018002 [Marasmius sp. AFHP31]